MYAYDENMLYKAQISLARMFDYAVNDYKISLESFYKYFLLSDISGRFESGDSNTIMGKSGTELAFEIIESTMQENNLPKPLMRLDRTPEYWVGYNLAYYQWKKGIAFERITDDVDITLIADMYHKYHEMDIRQFEDALDEMRDNNHKRNTLKRLRNYAQLSQRQLSDISGVSYRTIQQYEQGQKNINKASLDTVIALSRALRCKVEDLYMA